MTVPGAVKVIEEVARKMTAAKRSSEPALCSTPKLRGLHASRCAIYRQSRAQSRNDSDLPPIQHPVMPGALTPTEVVTAWTAGADFVKVFPAGSVGGASYIKNLKGPLPQIKFIPTGGVSLKTAADFIKAGASALGVGTDLVDVKAIREGEAHVVTEARPTICRDHQGSEKIVIGPRGPESRSKARSSLSSDGSLFRRFLNLDIRFQSHSNLFVLGCPDSSGFFLSCRCLVPSQPGSICCRQKSHPLPQGDQTSTQNPRVSLPA